MSAYKEMGEEELKKELQLLEEEYKKICQDNVKRKTGNRPAGAFHGNA